MNDKLKQALLITQGVELDPGDKVEFEHNYCGHNIVDVIVTDVNTGKRFVFYMYDTEKGTFPY